LNNPSQSSDAFAFLSAAERYYASLVSTAQSAFPGGEASLGGQLLYAGELSEDARALVVAGNVAGAATLCATADPARLRQANHEGIVDFVVTNLDEALRILKNEIRKKEPVAVCVGVEPGELEKEMLERGVQPDLVKAGVAAMNAVAVTPLLPAEDEALLAWQVAETPARWMPRLDALALECLGEGDAAARRWLRLAPRFGGRNVRGIRLVRCGLQAAAEFVSKVEMGVFRGEVGVAVELQMTRRGLTDQHRFVPGLPATGRN
jgi:hypothetical protein